MLSKGLDKASCVEVTRWYDCTERLLVFGAQGYQRIQLFQQDPKMTRKMMRIGAGIQTSMILRYVASRVPNFPLFFSSWHIIYLYLSTARKWWANHYHARRHANSHLWLYEWNKQHKYILFWELTIRGKRGMHIGEQHWIGGIFLCIRFLRKHPANYHQKSHTKASWWPNNTKTNRYKTSPVGIQMPHYSNLLAVLVVCILIMKRRLKPWA